MVKSRKKGGKKDEKEYLIKFSYWYILERTLKTRVERKMKRNT